MLNKNNSAQNFGMKDLPNDLEELSEAHTINETSGPQSAASCAFCAIFNRDESGHHSAEIAILYDKLQKLELMSSTIASIAQAPSEQKSKLREEAFQIKYSLLALFLAMKNILTHEKSKNTPATLHDITTTYIKEMIIMQNMRRASLNAVLLQATVDQCT